MEIAIPILIVIFILAIVILPAIVYDFFEGDE